MYLFFPFEFVLCSVMQAIRRKLMRKISYIRMFFSVIVIVFLDFTLGVSSKGTL